MTTHKTTLPSWTNPERESAGATALAPVLAYAHDHVAEQAKVLAAEWGVPAYEVQVWLAQMLTRGARLHLAWHAGEAEAASTPITDIAAAMGKATTGNGRHHAPAWPMFRRARDAAELTGQQIPVEVGHWRIYVQPR